MLMTFVRDFEHDATVRKMRVARDCGDDDEYDRLYDLAEALECPPMPWYAYGGRALNFFRRQTPSYYHKNTLPTRSSSWFFDKTPSDSAAD